MFLSPEQEDLKSLAEDNLYFIALSSYEITSFKKKNPVLYWTARISAPSRGVAMARTLPVMMEVAGPNLGRDTPKPIRVVAPHNYTPDIRVGPLQILSEEEPSAKPAAKTGP